MKKQILLIILVFGLITIFISCETDFDLTSDYQDVTVVYGLLNQDSNTYIRINKAFLGKESALIMAKIPDSSEYNNLDVKLEELEIDGIDTSVFKTIELDTIIIDNKKPGVFYYPYQKVYYTEEKLDEQRAYKLRIKVGGKKEVTAVTKLIPDFTMKQPSPYGEDVDFLENPNPAYSSRIRWVAPENGKLYEAMIRFTYKEIDADNDTIIRFFDWDIGSLETDQTSGGQDLTISYASKNFYYLCEQKIPYQNSEEEANVKKRIAQRVDFIISIADEEFTTYMKVNELSSSAIQIRPVYTNINNGLGLFASRYKKIRSKLLGLESIQILKERNIKF